MKEQLKKLRKELGLTQTEFAKKISLKQNTVASYEMGRIDPSDAVISLICKTFNVNESWLRTGSGEKFLPKNTKKELSDFFDSLSESDSFKTKLVTALSSLTEDQWAELADLASSLVADKNSVSNAEDIYKNSASSGAHDTDASASNTINEKDA